jgi:hypothetical protein
MELGPIPPVRTFAADRELPADFQLSAVLEINPAARSGDARSGERRKNAAAAAAAASDEDELTLAGQTETVPEAGAEQPADTPPHSINLFA